MYRRFPDRWANPFNLDNLNSGAILVGAGAPLQGINNRNHGPTRSRLPFSNYGRRVDVQGWGACVTTTGNKNPGLDLSKSYTQQFSGTSSAAPIVAGALGCVQGILRASGKPPLTPEQARKLLLDTGSPQQGDTSERIGNLPDLRKLIQEALNAAV